MFGLYSRTENKSSTLYRFKKQINLFGCNVGFIPKMVSKCRLKKVTSAQTWYVDVHECLNSLGIGNTSLLIDIKPNRTDELFICELINIWGYSYKVWTPVLFQLKELCYDNVSRKEAKTFLRLSKKTEPTIIYSFLHMHGGIWRGKLFGKWSPPGPSSTNSTLLWPDALNYFHAIITNIKSSE
jgi:hypothetical protein